MTTEVTPIPSMRAVYRDTKANLDTLINLRDGDLAYGTDTTVLYRQNGIGAANWEAITIAAGINLAVKVSDTLRNSNDPEKQTNSLTYIKAKECLLNADLAVCRIKFHLEVSADITTAYAQIYKNGVPIGIERSNNTVAGETFSEDFADFVSGDLIQIYYKTTDSGYYTQTREFRFYYSQFVTHIGGSGLVTELETIFDPTISITNQDP